MAVSKRKVPIWGASIASMHSTIRWATRGTRDVEDSHRLLARP